MLITLLGVVLPAWHFKHFHLITPLTLGVIAAAIAETNDYIFGRVKAITFTLVCFAIAAFSIELLFDLPYLFAIGLFSSTFLFIMMGSIGPKYASITFGSLMIAIYTMLGADSSTNLWEQPLLLLVGASWYYFVSMLWQMIWPLQPVQQSMSTLFLDLADYLDSKSELFYPSFQLNLQKKRIEETRKNAITVTSLEHCKQLLINRSRSSKGHVDGPSDRFLNLYFIAQDIHERASSSHFKYQDLTNKFNRSDLLFRFQHLLNSQAKSCRKIAHSFRYNTQYHHSEDAVIALDDLQESLSFMLKERSLNEESATQIQVLFNNLTMVEKQLAMVNNPDLQQINQDTELYNAEPKTLKQMWSKIRSNMTISSPLFRHALRLASALTLGYGIIKLFDIEQGYWILLTILFVCQPNFSATQLKLVDRTIGTLLGLFVGVPLLTIFPSQESQLLFIVISGVAFFAFRLNNYRFATFFITLLVLFCFNQLGEGYAVVLPRLVDTLIGCAISVVAIRYFLPNWESRHIPKAMSQALLSSQTYLAKVIGQYGEGKDDHLNYRKARRHAHTQDANLSTTIHRMLMEPGKYQLSSDACFRFLTLSHVLLSYVSALGAHRTQITDEYTHNLILDTHRVIDKTLSDVIQRLLYPEDFTIEVIDNVQSLAEMHSFEEQLKKWRDTWKSEPNQLVKLVLQQLHLMYSLMPELLELSKELTAVPIEPVVEVKD